MSEVKNNKYYNAKEDIKNSYMSFLLTDSPKKTVKQMSTHILLFKQGKRSNRGTTSGLM